MIQWKRIATVRKKKNNNNNKKPTFGRVCRQKTLEPAGRTLYDLMRPKLSILPSE